jgi:hypothetical protein
MTRRNPAGPPIRGRNCWKLHDLAARGRSPGPRRAPFLRRATLADAGAYSAAGTGTGLSCPGRSPTAAATARPSSLGKLPNTATATIGKNQTM